MQEKLFNKNFNILCLAQLASGVSFFMLLPIMPLYLVTDMGVSKSMAGVIVSLYTIGALMVRPLSGPLVDRFQRKPMMLITMLLFAFSCAGYIFAVHLLAFAVFRFVHGIFFSLSSTSTNTVAIDNMPPSKMGTGIGLVGVIISLSMALAPMVGLELMSHFTARITFTVATGFAFLSCLLAVLVKAPKRKISKDMGPLLNPKNLILQAGLWPAFAYLLTIFSYGLTSNYIALLAYERGLDHIAGSFFLFLSAGLVLSRLFSGMLLDKGYLSQIILAGQLMVVVSFAYVLLGTGPIVFLSSGLLLGLGFGMCMPSFQGLVISLAPPERIGTANSTFYLSMDVGIGLAVLTGGVIADLTNLTTTYAFGAVLVVVAMAIFITKCMPLVRTLGENTAPK